MTMSDLTAKTEAIIFASGDPVSIDRIAQVLTCKSADIEKVIEFLSEKYNHPSSGIHLAIMDRHVQFCTNPAFIEPVRAALDLRRKTPLSQAALEVLAVIAYNQPVTKAFVEQVRGVDCSGVITSLMQKGLLEERGRLELPGRPLLYGTTDVFLQTLGISSIVELPDPPKTRQGVREEDGQMEESEQLQMVLEKE